MKQIHWALANQRRPIHTNDRQAAAAATMQKLSGDEIWRMDDLDSTQTIRTLTKAELSDANQPKWYVVQLALSNQAVNMEAMPQTGYLLGLSSVFGGRHGRKARSCMHYGSAFSRKQFLRRPSVAT